MNIFYGIIAAIIFWFGAYAIGSYLLDFDPGDTLSFRIVLGVSVGAVSIVLIVAITYKIVAMVAGLPIW